MSRQQRNVEIVRMVPTVNRFAVQQARLRVVEVARKLLAELDKGIDFGWDEECKHHVDFERTGKCPGCGTEFKVEDRQECGATIEVEKLVEVRDILHARELASALLTLDTLGG
jgi:hypothetical protein